MAEGSSSHPRTAFLGIAAIAVIAYAACDLAHELLGHGLATLLPLGVRALSVSTIGLTTTASSPVVAAAGPLLNLLLASALFLAGNTALSPAWRYFCWVFGSINAFNATAYLLYSSILGSGDCAVVFDAIDPSRGWRVGVGIAGVALYAIAVFASFHALRGLTRDGVIAGRNADGYCTGTYWVGGALLTLGAAFNPVGPMLILTSGAATGFGAMVGLVILPGMLARSGAADASKFESLRIGRGWIVAAGLVAIVFVAVFGHGVTWGRV